jgi:hypothetical protein
MPTAYHITDGAFTFRFGTDAKSAVARHPDEWRKEPWPEPPVRDGLKSEPVSIAPDRITAEIEKLTDRVIAFRKCTAMDRLTEKFAKASGVVGRQNAKIEARLDRLIAREPDIEQKTDQAFVPHEATLDGLENGLDTVEASLRLLSNGAPLDSSSDSPASPQAASPPTSSPSTGEI